MEPIAISEFITFACHGDKPQPTIGEGVAEDAGYNSYSMLHFHLGAHMIERAPFVSFFITKACLAEGMEEYQIEYGNMGRKDVLELAGEAGDILKVAETMKPLMPTLLAGGKEQLVMMMLGGEKASE